MGLELVLVVAPRPGFTYEIGSLIRTSLMCVTMEKTDKSSISKVVAGNTLYGRLVMGTDHFSLIASILFFKN